VIITPSAENWLRRAIGGEDRPFEIARMKGSSSSSIYLVNRGAGHRFVLRVLDNSEWLAAEPDLAEHEAAALREARSARLKAPDLLACTSGDVGFGAPVVLMSFADGQIDLLPSDFDVWLGTLAGELAAIHCHPGEGFPWTFRSWADHTVSAPPEWTRIPQIWERALARFHAGEPHYNPCFIHRDYHPMNVLWNDDGSISGVVDWINACRGPAGVDVAHCRTNLAAMYGPSAADRFLDSYLEQGGRPFDPYWDIDSLVDMCVPQPGWYPPWNDFGLQEIEHEVLCARMDEHLERAIARLD
jgi:aminoglycoside phosphotransferase (APT) family kinase protein